MTTHDQDGLPRPDRIRRLRRPVIVLVVCLAVAYGGGFLAFVHLAARVSIDVTAATEAIVVLTGGSERFQTGAALLRSDVADRLFVSGVHPGVRPADLLVQAGLAPDPDAIARIELGHAARDTAGNAAETAAWVRESGVGSLRLVTSDYHMPRSLLEFRSAMPGVRIVPHPVSAATVHLAEWWLWPGTAQLAFVEYNKLLVTWVRIQTDWAWQGVGL